MIFAGVGLSTESSSGSAAREAAERAVAGLPGRRADFAIAFATAEHAEALSDLLGALGAGLATPYVAGCSAAGVLAGGREIEGGPAVGVLAVCSDSIRGTPFLFEDAGDAGLTAGVNAGQRLIASRGTNDLILAWPDPHAVHPDRLLQGLDATLGPVPVAGGAASSALPGVPSFQFSGSEAGSGCVSGLRLGGAFRHHLALTQGCRPLGQPMRVTSAHDNLLLEVEGIAAYEALRRAAPGPFFDTPEATMSALTIALLPEPGESVLRPGEYLVRAGPSCSRSASRPPPRKTSCAWRSARPPRLPPAAIDSASTSIVWPAAGRSTAATASIQPRLRGTFPAFRCSGFRATRSSPRFGGRTTFLRTPECSSSSPSEPAA